MMVSASILSIKDNLKENVLKLDQTNIDYLHLDIMDGKFVNNKTWRAKDLENILIDTEKPKDVHLMVNDVKKYIDEFRKLDVDFITFHIEAVNNVLEIINYLKELNIKVGISIKPNTSIDKIKDYLDIIDLVLIMSVEPGLGGQTFIENSVNKIDELYDLREKNNFHYLIEIDGGINDETIKKCNKCDMVVVGSFITNTDDYEKQVNKMSNFV